MYPLFSWVFGGTHFYHDTDPSLNGGGGSESLPPLLRKLPFLGVVLSSHGTLYMHMGKRASKTILERNKGMFGDGLW